MIFMAFSMYWEAKPFIEYLELKKDDTIHPYQVFKNHNVVAMITGVGLIPSSIGITYVLSRYEPSEEDLFVNIGICGAKKEGLLGNIYLCNKIIEEDDHKTFYPDILFHHPFEEASLCSSSIPCTKNMYKSIKGDLVDMEGAGVYQGARVFLSPHQMCFLKVVSDDPKKIYVNGKEIEGVFEEHKQKICTFLLKVHKHLPHTLSILSMEDEKMFARISYNFHLTQSMKHLLRRYLESYKLRHEDLKKIGHTFLKIKCREKRERKMYFDRLKRTLMEY